jgi:hypothetical protein
MVAIGVIADNGSFWPAKDCPLMTLSGHAMRCLGQVNAAGTPYAAPVKAESPANSTMWMPFFRGVMAAAYWLFLAFI